MDVIFGTHVDLITPFPESEIPRIWSWMQCFQSMAIHDHSIKKEEYNDYMRKNSEMGLTFGIIDKNNLTSSHSVEAPIVGSIILEPAGPTNCYGHIATSRKAGKSYKNYGISLVDEAVNLVVQHVFDTYPNLLRVSALVLESNRPVRSLLSRCGFIQDGQLDSWFTQSGESKNACHYGRLRG